MGGTLTQWNHFATPSPERHLDVAVSFRFDPSQLSEPKAKHLDQIYQRLWGRVHAGPVATSYLDFVLYMTYLGGNFCALYTYAVALPSLAEMLKRHNKIMVKVVDGKQR
jgi:hypothetical protein